MRKGHPQDTSHPATQKVVESNPETELHSVVSFKDLDNPESTLAGTILWARIIRIGHLTSEVEVTCYAILLRYDDYAILFLHYFLMQE